MTFGVPDDLNSGVDLEEVRRALKVLIPPGRTFELRSLPTGRSWVGTEIDTALSVVPELATGSGMYFMMNPVRPDLKGAAKNKDILERYWFLVDVDSVRVKKDDPATDAEKLEAANLAHLVRLDLKSRGCPDPIVVDSGNGYQLFYRVSLPNDDLAHKWVSLALKRLADIYNTAGAEIDLSVHNAGRLARLPGTWNRKGESTSDRPHRLARLEVIPDQINEIPIEIFREIAGLRAVKESNTDGEQNGNNISPRLAEWTVPTLNGANDAAWYKKALVNEAGGVALAHQGDRHNTLRAAARTLAGYIHHGHLTAAEITAALTLAGERAGLDIKDIRDAIAWGIENGQANPLPTPEKLIKTPKGAKPDKESTPLDPSKPLIIWGSQITPRKVEWLWQDRVPMGKLTTFAGVGGLGKTFVLCDLAARVSNGDEWPFSGGVCAQRGKVLFISGEDEADDTLVPRMIELGADLSQIAFLTTEALDRFQLSDINAMDVMAHQMGGVQFVVIDPPTAYLGGVNDHKNSELRALLTPLKSWASKQRCALIFNTHVSKPQSVKVDAMMRVMGSVAWVNAVRAAHMFAQDPDDADRCLFVGMKTNLGAKPKGLAFQIVKTEALATVKWLGEVDTTADEAVNRDEKKARTISARDWLIELFNKQREWPSDQFWASAREHGIGKRNIDEAKIALLVPRARRTVGTDGDITYVFWVPPNWEYLKGNQNDGTF
jgi:hypothetical protein